MKQVAVVIGSRGGIGSALQTKLRDGQQFDTVLGLNRADTPKLDLLNEASIKSAAGWVKDLKGEIRLVVDATGGLTVSGSRPEKSLREIDPVHLAEAYAINAIGPALLMKHFLPLLPRQGRSVFATLSARVGSIGDNQLGGWYAYRASKAALNQLVKTAAIEMSRKAPDAICVALHPGTVKTPLTDSFAKSGLDVQTPHEAAVKILTVLRTLEPRANGGFFDHKGERIPW
ncbi:SDR family NAD(P)-dependent oxidoreductase [uncultured Roseibium sp.]|uniref:SDR family NAD(P)-dependent oxidoreductase n=1 Tax=uncultured Roseibium sp. TaxID=1936171 RepID=UPI0026222594|nr:SDR family NAD(P)-dependent oxidoreductase [uncultured Roseibium sp.]